jgi:hypothetical protein
MRGNGSGPASVATEGEARKMDRLAWKAHKIDSKFEN